MNHKPELPVDAILPDVLASLDRQPNLVIEAAPGAGKTTRVPPALLAAVRGGILVLEPRRIAARLAARRVAEELGEAAGGTVGYQVRFEDVSGPKTRLRFMTEGVLTRRLLSDPSLSGIDAVVLDEFHERHLESDVAVALLKRLQRSRPALRIVVMSATLDAAPVALYLDNCPVVASKGRHFEITIRHLPYSPEPLHVQVREGAASLLESGCSGHILVFLPGSAEIRRAMRACEGLARQHDLLLLPLHGELAPREQDRAVAPGRKRKLILATNVAESSITVEGVSAVIDSGLARFATDSPWTGLPTLQIGRISKASARQRAGRAGRTGPGEVLRLYSEEDYLHRPDFNMPEIRRAELSQPLLSLRAMGIAENELEWLEPPPEAAVRTAAMLLDRLGARGALGRRLARYPLPPRLSRLLVQAVDLGVGMDGCAAAALLGSGIRSDRNDLLAAIESPQEPRIVQQTEQLQRLTRTAHKALRDDDALLKAVLAGFPDRVARVRTGNQVLLSAGGSAEIAGEPPRYEFMVAVDAEDRKEKPLPLIRMTARIEPEWLIDLFPERMSERSGVLWNAAAQRVDAVSALLYDELVIQESRDTLPDPEAAASLLAAKAAEAGVEHFVDAGELAALQARAEFAGIEPPNVAQLLRELSSGLRSFAELKAAAQGLLPALERRMNPRLEELAPARLRLAKGRLTRVHYERGKLPSIASQLQDFFGMRETPRLGAERTPVVIHLLAPNRRAVQTTTDLAGFWERLYPQVRRELMRRYPRHAWPERP